MDSPLDQKFNIRLVQTIQKYPIIYNTNLKGYKDSNWLYHKDKAWEAVAKKLQTEPSILKKRWKWLRTVLRKKLRAKQMGKYVRPYYLYDHIKFVIPFLKDFDDFLELNDGIKYEEAAEVEYKDDVNNQYEADSGKNVDKNDITTEGIYETEHDPLNFDNDEDDDFNSPNTSILSEPEEKHKTVKNDFHISKPADGQTRRSNIVQNSSIITSTPSYVASTSTEKMVCGQIAAANGNAKIQFLNSILPDLNEMSNSQMRHFKSRVLQLVDDVLREH